jgi:hypothetical protein
MPRQKKTKDGGIAIAIPPFDSNIGSCVMVVEQPPPQFTGAQFEIHYASEPVNEVRQFRIMVSNRKKDCLQQ